MNDDFDKRLQQVAPREIPSTWREEILITAQSAAPASHPASTHLKVSSHQIALSVWRELILPARRIWIGLAATWILLLIANTQISDTPRTTVSAQRNAPVELWQRYQEEKQLLAELAGLPEPKAVAPAMPFAPRPRSERLPRWKTV